MPKDGKIMSSLEMRTLIFDALAEEDTGKTPWKQTFQMYRYRGSILALRSIVEFRAIERGLIDKVVDIPLHAWGVPGGIPYYGGDTNFTEDEIDLFSEEVRLLMFQNVISPGAAGSYGDDWPYFHVTKYGLECLKNRDVLPYDPEGYLSKLSAVASVDDWEKFYISQSLSCFNAGALESSIIMLGLAGEYLATRLINSMDSFLAKNDTALYAKFQTNLTGKNKISQRYSEYEKILKEVESQKDASGNIKYTTLKSLAPLLDVPAKTVYATYLRLTRNELAHPSGVKMDRTESLTMLISYIKYCETQHKYLDFYISNS